MMLMLLMGLLHRYRTISVLAAHGLPAGKSGQVNAQVQFTLVSPTIKDHAKKINSKKDGVYRTKVYVHLSVIAIGCPLHTCYSSDGPFFSPPSRTA